MSRQTSIRNLQIITALDSISFGLLYRFIYTKIEKLGANQTTSGFLATGITFGNIMSPRVATIFTSTYGKKYGLFFILSIAMLCHIMTTVTKNVTFAICMRILFSFINQCRPICLELLMEQERNHGNKEKLQANYNILSGLGFILGPVIGGHLIEKEKGFRNVGMLIILLSLFNVILLTSLSDTEEGRSGISCENRSGSLSEDESVVTKYLEIVSQQVGDVKKGDFSTNWDVLVLRYFFASGCWVLFIKFYLLLRDNYSTENTIHIGYTIAFMNCLLFVSTCYVGKAKQIADCYPLMFVTELAFFSITIFTLLACLAPVYELFLLLLIPMIFLRTFIMALWDDLYLERKHTALGDLMIAAGFASGLTVPMLFGYVYDRLTQRGTIIFICGSMLLCWAIIRHYTKYLKFEKQIDNPINN